MHCNYLSTFNNKIVYRFYIIAISCTGRQYCIVEACVVANTFYLTTEYLESSAMGS